MTLPALVRVMHHCKQVRKLQPSTDMSSVCPACSPAEGDAIGFRLHDQSLRAIQLMKQLDKKDWMAAEWPEPSVPLVRRACVSVTHGFFDECAHVE